jgi:hypothetical protein
MKAFSVDFREWIVATVRRGMSEAQAARTVAVGAARVTHPAGRRRRLLPPEERMLVAHAALGVPTLADRLLPL